MENYEFRTEPYEHQRRAMSKAWLKKSFAWLMEMGTGKTKVAIDEMCALWEKGLIDAVVVIAPKGVYMNWIRSEFPTHMPHRIYDSASIVEWRAGGGGKAHSERLVDLLHPEKLSGLPVLVMNVEALSSGTHGYVFISRFVKAYERVAIYVDESTTIKNYAATRTKRVTEIGGACLYRRIMTGFAAPRSPLDIYSQFAFLGTALLGFTSYFSFRNRYAVLQQHIYGGRRVQIVVGYRDVEDLSRKIEPHSFRVTKEECLDLPPKVYTVREVEMTEDQSRVYQEMKEKGLAELTAPKKCEPCGGSGYRTLVENGEKINFPCGTCGGIGTIVGTAVSAQQVIVQILRLHQILCGHVTAEDGVSYDVPTNRIRDLIEVLQEADSKTIIWACYRRDIEKIVEVIQKEFGETSVVQYHGGTSQADRENAIYRFQGRVFDRECPIKDQAQFFVGNAQTGGFGITLTAAKTVVYYSNSYDLEKRLQSEDRAHRSGQSKSVTYVDLVCRGTVDEKILAALRNKINISSAIMGDDFREWLV